MQNFLIKYYQIEFSNIQKIIYHDQVGINSKDSRFIPYNKFKKCNLLYCHAKEQNSHNYIKPCREKHLIKFNANS